MEAIYKKWFAAEPPSLPVLTSNATKPASLPKTLRTDVLMRDLQELSYHEIAHELRLPEGTVKSRINRGRSELARQIRKLRGEHFSPSGIGGVH